jgi:hypothetical protein
MQTTTNTQERKFDIDRKHTVGQFLNAHPEAKQVVHTHRREAKEFFNLSQRNPGGPLNPRLFPQARSR